jgi:hypothetical protein
VTGTRLGTQDAAGPGSCWVVGTAGPGSAGATTTAVAMARHASALMVEADGDGGVLGFRYGGWLGREAPSLASLLAALSQGERAAALEAHAQLLPCGVPVVVSAPGGEDAVGPVEQLGRDLPALREALPGVRLVLDCGRLRPEGTGLGLGRQADALVVVLRPSEEGIGTMFTRLHAFQLAAELLVVGVRGEGRYPFGNVRDAIADHSGGSSRVRVVHLPEDPRAVAALARPRHGRGDLRDRRAPASRAGLVAAVAGLCDMLQAGSGYRSGPEQREPLPPVGWASR